MKTISRSIIFLLITFQFVNSYSQSSESAFKKEITQYFDSIYGADNLLINGRIFMYPNFRAKGDPFFYGKERKLCDVYINSRKFSNLYANYNIADDKLIISTDINNNKVSIELNSHLIDSFYISYVLIKQNYNQNAANFSSNISDPFNPSKDLIIKKIFINPNKLGFYENIYEGKIQLLKKYIKNFSDKVSQDYPYGTFTNQKTVLYINRDGKIINVANKKKFISTFKMHKKEINKFLRLNKIKYKNANNNELIKLMTYCEKLM